MNLDVKNLHKSFSQGERQVVVLDGLSLQVKKGELVAIMGPSGCGKSTLLSLLAGLERPDRGNIFIGQKDITNLNEAELAEFRSRHVGIVFQQYHLVSSLNALENVSLPLEWLDVTGAVDTAEDLLKSVGLAERLNHFPHQLSGGEAQRVAICRALATLPTVIFADEPSGNLDTDTGNQVIELLFEKVRDLDHTLVLVTHNPDLASRCDRVLHLDHGKLSG